MITLIVNFAESNFIVGNPDFFSPFNFKPYILALTFKPASSLSLIGP
jgi:hypothetical protein